MEFDFLVLSGDSRPLLKFALNVCKNESSSLGIFIALSARSDGRGGHDILFSVL